MTFRKIEIESNFAYLLRLSVYAFVFFLVIYRLSVVFSFKHELVNGESNNLWNAMNVAHGKNIYSNPEDLPLEVFQYTPLSQFPLIAFAHLLDDTSPYYLYWLTVLGRLTSFIANILTAWIFIKLMIEVFGVRKDSAFYGGVFIFASFTHAAFAIRPDALTLLITTYIGVGIFKAIHDENKKRIVLLSGFTAFAVLFKQDAFFLLVPLGVFLVIQRDWKSVFWVGFCFLICLVILLLIGHLTLGQYFLYSITKGIQNPSSISQALIVFDKVFSLFGFQLLLAPVLIVTLFQKKFLNKTYMLLMIFVVSYILLGFLSSFKHGAWINYYTPGILWITVLIIISIEILGLNEMNIPIVIFVAGIFTFRQIYFYTLPYVWISKPKKEYLSRWQFSNELKKYLVINNGTQIIVVDQLCRNFLFQNTIMVNTEFYGISPFNYKKIQSEEKKKIKYIITSPSDEQQVKDLIFKFNVNLSKYYIDKKYFPKILYIRNN